jgi:hypothetical protein
LIGRLAKDNPEWGAPKIHAQLQKLGSSLAERIRGPISSWRGSARGYSPAGTFHHRAGIQEYRADQVTQKNKMPVHLAVQRPPQCPQMTAIIVQGRPSFQLFPIPRLFRNQQVDSFGPSPLAQ